MNWGKSIVLAFVCFAAFIGYMVVRAFQEDFDLVADDYYAQEINYQSKLDQLSNASKNDFEVMIDQNEETITLTFPSEASGEIHFYHPSRKIFDRKFKIELDQNNSQQIAKTDLVPGSYRVNISCSAGDKKYFQKTSIYLK